MNNPMLKPAQVHMLPAKEDRKNNTLYLTTGNFLVHTHTSRMDAVPQDLYFTDDSEIKEGDWFLKDSRTLHKCTKVYQHGLIEANYHSNPTVGKFPWGKKETKKIIATTNKELWDIRSRDLIAQATNTRGIPKILPSFIEEFIKEQGKIDRVMLEYLDIGGSKEYYPSLRTTSDGSVIIHYPFKETMKSLIEKALVIIAEELATAGARKYVNINNSGYSQIERNIAERIVKLTNQ